MQQEERLLPPYLPFKTLQTALDILAVGLPDQIDRTVFRSLAWNVQGDVLRSFRFLGLTDRDGQIQPPLRQLVEDADNRKATLRKVLETSYSEIISAIDLSKATPQQFDQAMAVYGVKSATHRKAVTFFLQAAQFAEVPLSSWLAGKIKPRRSKPNGTGSRRRKSPGTPQGNETPSNPTPPPNEQVNPDRQDDKALDDLIAAVVGKLPRERAWTTKQRERWLQALTANLDLIFEIQEEETAANSTR